jgi:hypothetical protein
MTSFCVQPTDNLSTFGDLVGANDCIAFPEANQVQVRKKQGMRSSKNDVTNFTFI